MTKTKILSVKGVRETVTHVAFSHNTGEQRTTTTAAYVDVILAENVLVVEFMYRPHNRNG